MAVSYFCSARFFAAFVFAWGLNGAMQGTPAIYIQYKDLHTARMYIIYIYICVCIYNTYTRISGDVLLYTYVCVYMCVLCVYVGKPFLLLSTPFLCLCKGWAGPPCPKF